MTTAAPTPRAPRPRRSTSPSSRSWGSHLALGLAWAISLAGTLATTACASAPSSREPEPDEAQLRLVRAELRVVGSDSTWVARGTGYELVTWSRADIVRLQPALEEQARVFRRLFSAEPRPVVVAARRGMVPEVGAGRRSAMPVKMPPVPASEVTGPGAPELVEITFLIPNETRSNGRASREVVLRSPDSLLRAPKGAGEQVMERWLVALAARMASADGRPGSVPRWVRDAFPRLVDQDDVEGVIAVQLAAHPNRLSSVSEVFDGRCATMDAGAGDPPAPTSTRPRDLRQLREGPPLQGEVRCAAQALLIARYLMSREGYAALGRIAAAQMVGGSASDGLAGARTVPSDLAQLDREWRRWLQAQADQAGVPERE